MIHSEEKRKKAKKTAGRPPPRAAPGGRGAASHLDLSSSHHAQQISSLFIRLCDALCLRSCALALKKQSVAEWTQAEDTPTAGGLVLQELLVVAEVISIQN